MKKHYLPSSFVYMIFDSIKEQLGDRGLTLLLKRAGLERYIKNPPKNDDTPSLSSKELAEIAASTYTVFGEKAAKPLLLRWGRMTFEQSLNENPTLFGVAGALTTLMGQERKERFFIKRILNELEKIYDTPRVLTEDDTYFYIEITDCPYTGGIHTDHPICYPAVGFWRAVMKWITGNNHEVMETACVAMGDESCMLRIAKHSL